MISQEKEKSQLMVREITEITEELQNSIEFKKQELELIDASNLAMIEGIRKETAEKVDLFKEKMEEEVDQLHRKISKLKYEMKKRHIF